ncbi:hypothetical protein ACX0HA_15205, partial [Flavobacterium hauense]
MRNFTSKKLRIVILLGLFLTCLTATAQTPVPPGFSPRLVGGNMKVKGDVVFVGNNILNRTPNPNDPLNGGNDNNSYNMEFIDIDNDSSTRNSSSANLVLNDCDRIVYAGLYWASTYPYEWSTDNSSQWNPSNSNRYYDFNQIKFKMATGGYIDITGSILFDGRAPVLNQSFKDSPAICYYDVTSLVQGQSDAEGTYTVANMRSSQGMRNGSSSAGWVMVVIYENPSATSKFISTFDGYAGITSGEVDININGFKTLPAPNPVIARLGVAALEGDKGLDNDKLQFKANLTTGWTDIGNGLNPTNNFFNSTITNNNQQVLTRNPNGTNTLGLDLDMLSINNTNNAVIKNNETGAKLRLYSRGDGYGAFLATFAVDIIEPDIRLTKRVLNGAGKDIAGTDVILGQDLYYEITYKNIGNDNAQNLTIRDVLPVNTSFVEIVSKPSWVGVNTSVPGTITFTNNDDTKIVKDDPITPSPTSTILFKVRVAATCNELTDMCANRIENQAFARYRGFVNTNFITDDPSIASFLCSANPGPANTLVDVANCQYRRTEILCGPNLTLTAGDGYPSYAWFRKDPAGDVPMGTTQSIVVNVPGEYYVINTPTPPCVGLTEFITVNLSSNLPPNPLTVSADLVGVCANNGIVMSNIFLCGSTAQRALSAGTIAGTATWYKLNSAAACSTPVLPANCPHNSCPAASWLLQHTGTNYTVTTGGEYKLVINNNGCTAEYFFNVTKNDFDPVITRKDVFCGANGEIKVNNATSDYEYRFLTQSGTVLQAYSANPVYVVTTPGVYQVQLRQIGVANGCTFTVDNIGVRDANLVIDIKSRDITCSTLTPAGITVTPSGLDLALPAQQYKYTMTGPMTQSSAWMPTSDPYSFPATGLLPGTYTITVTTNPGTCTKIGTVTIRDFSHPVATASVQKGITCNPGTIKITATGGTEPYTFAAYSKDGVNLTAPATADFFDGIYSVPVGEQGTYIFLVTDGSGCTTYSNPVTITNVAPVITTAFTNPKCNTGSTGTITVSATGSGVTYELTSGATIITSGTSGAFSNLAAGSYTVNVKQLVDTISCTYPRIFNLVAPAAVAGTASITTQLTCAPGGATITADIASGGTAPYEYSIDGTTFGTGRVFSGLGAGTYSVTIKDANGCIHTTASMTLTAPVPMTGVTIGGSALTCPSETSDVSLSAVVGGQAPYSYAITAPASAAVSNGTNATFAGLSPGVYTFTITDAKGCTYSKSHPVNAITPISIVGVRDNQVRCSGTATGAATFTVSGFGANYNYTVTSTGTPVTPATVTAYTSDTISLTSLGAGTYTVTVTNPTTNCTASAFVTIANPTAPLAVTKKVVQPTCVVTTGSLEVTATNGWGGYNYALSGQAAVGPQASPNFENLAAGNYTLTVTDANGCIITDTFTITGAVAPVITVTASDLCIDATPTSITVTVTTGTGLAPFQFSLNGAPYQNGTGTNSTTYTNLAVGSYSITVKDANGCVNATAVTRTINSQLTASTTLDKGLTCAPAPTDAQISVSIGGGATPYEYQVSHNGGAYTALASVGGTTLTYNTAVAGTYEFRITDAAGCTVTTAPRTIAPLVNPEFAFGLTTDILCHGASTGALTVNIDTTKGLPPFTLSVTNTDTSTPYLTQTTGLPAGMYEVVITDANGCTFIASEEIEENDAIAFTTLETNIQCIDDPNNPGTNISAGEILVQAVTGGQGPYTYRVSNNFGYTASSLPTAATTYPFIILNYGIYEVIVTDANGCTAVKPNIIMTSPPNRLDIDVTTIVPATCADGGSAVVEVDAIITGTAYQFAILETNLLPYAAPASYKGPDNPLVPRVATFDNLTPGATYTFVVYDASNRCYYFQPATIPAAISDLAVTSLTKHDVTCKGSGNGRADFSFTVTSGATTVNYQVYEAQSNEIVATAGASGSVSVAAGAGSGSVTGLPPGTYYIEFEQVDGNAGCKAASAQFTIAESPNLLLISAVATKKDNTCTPNAGQVVITGEQGTGTYTYQLVAAGATEPTTWVTTNTFNRDSGSYDAYVKDANNCIKTVPVTILLDVLPAVTAVLAPGTQCTTAEGNFTINVTRTANAAVGPFLYSVDGGAFEAQGDTFSVAGLASGVHTVQIKDANGCVATAAASVTIFVPLSVTALPTVQPTCLNGNLGTITASGTGGSATGNLRYELQTAAGAAVRPQQLSGVFTLVPAGNYKVVISDTSTICTAEALVTLDATVTVTFNTTKDDVNCNGGTDGSISIILPGSNTDIPYSYTIDGVGAPVTQSTPIFTNLAADTYTVTVTSGKGCTATSTVIIGTPTAVGVTASVTTPFACAPDNSVTTATVTAVGSGGTTPYTYSIDGTNYEASGVFALASTGSAQNKTITIKDDNGCTTTTSVIINALPVMATPTAVLTTAIECDDNQGVITVAVTGGSGDFTFTMLPSGTPVNTLAGDRDQTFTITEPGVYTFEVKDDVTGCTKIVSAAEIFEYDIIDVTATASTPVTCFGSSTGSVTIDVANTYTGPYSYTVFNGNTSVVSGTGNTTTNPLIITALPAGNLFVRITATASPYCTTDSNVIRVGSPALPLTPNAAMTANVTCTNDKGEITALATGGWGGYEYELVDTATSGILVNYSTDNVFTGLIAGTYTVNVKDSKNCIRSQNVPLALPVPLAASATPLTTLVQCNNDATATVTAAATGGQGTYEYILNTYDASGTIVESSTGAQLSPVFANLGAGIYSISVVDGWECGPLETNQVTVTQPAPLTGALSLTTGQTCLTQAVITLVASGGTAPYEYSLDGGTTYIPFGPSATATFSRPTGSYQYQVIDANSCGVALTNEVVVPAVPALDIALDLAAAEISCSGGNNASITAIATGGLGNYQYSLLNASNTVIAGPTTNPTFENLGAGTYSIRVDSGDCNTTSVTHTINNPAPLTSVPTVNNIICYGKATGSIVMATTGGSGTVQYAISPNLSQFTNNNVFSLLRAGTYNIIVQDQNGCFLTFTRTVTEPTEIHATIQNVTDEACLGASNGTIRITVTGGTGTYSVSTDDITYTPFDPATPTTYLLTGLPAGDTTVYVKDQNGCSLSPPLEQPILEGVDMNPQVAVVETCVANAPANTVTISVTPSVNAVGVIDYSLDGLTWQASNVFTVVDAIGGNYTAHARHTMPATAPTPGLQCIQDKTFVITGHTAIAATPSITQTIDCFGGLGEITLDVTAGAGTGPFEYAIGPLFTYGAPNVFGGLAAGTYNFKIKDDIGCELDITGVVLSQPTAALSVGQAFTNEICFGDEDGSITITPAGGTSPYTVSIDGGTTFTLPAAGPFSFTLLEPATYNIVVSDANGCSPAIATTPIVITAGVDIEPSAYVDQYCQSNVIHNTILLQDLNGNTDLEYSLDGAAYRADVDYYDVAAGLHTVTIRHINGCVQTRTFTVDALLPISASVTATTNVNCFGDATGAITVTATDGTGTLSYAIADADVLPLVFGNYQSTGVFTALEAGNYIVSILDDGLTCETRVTATITEPAAALVATAGPQTNVLCFGNATGAATVNVTGGTGAYSYSWDTTPVQTTATATGLAAGTYTVTVTDANACITTQTFTITQPTAALTATAAGTQTNVLCFGNTTGTATVDVTGGTGAYSYSWNTTPVQTTATATGLAAGTYTVTVTDANACTTTQTFTITQPAAALVATAGSQTNILCFGNATGTATVNVTGGTGAYTYSWNTTPAQTTATATGLTAGTYTVTVTDANGCTTTQPFTITQPAAALVATAGPQTNVLCFGNTTGAATVNVTGGTGAYSYSWNTTPVQTAATATGLAAGTYTVTVTDANACTTTQVFTITQPAAALTATAGPQTNVLCFGNATGAATVNVTGGTTAYSYSWNTTPVQTTATATGLIAGTYTVTVTDANGCTTTQAFTITQPAAALVATAGPQTNVLCFGNATGAATVNVTGGTTAYSYSWNTTPVQTGATATGLAAGTYTVTVTDANACTTTQSFTITQPAAALVATAGPQTNILCFGNATGAATVNVTGGTGAYSYSWNTTPVQTAATATGLTAG